MDILQLVTKAELAAELSVSTRTIENWMLSALLPKATYIGRRAYWPRPLIETWKQAQFSAVLNAPVHIVDQPMGFVLAPPRPRGLSRRRSATTT